MMNIQPEKPHFLKPILPIFKNGIKIPPSFFRFLNGLETKRAVLKRGGKNWDVKIKQGCFVGDGWRNFAEDNDLQVGDFAFFRHEGNMMFEVLVCDESSCVIECLTNDAEQVEPEEQIRQENSLESLNSIDLELGEPNVSPVADSRRSRDYPHFVSVIRGFSTLQSRLHLPFKFARENGLTKYCKIILVDDLQRSWPVGLAHGAYRCSLGMGWLDFCNSNGFKVGDQYKFELIKIENTPVANFTLGTLRPKIFGYLKN